MKKQIQLFLFIFGAVIFFNAEIFSQSAAPTLTSPADNSTNYGFSKVSYAWSDVEDASTYELQVCKTDSFKTADGVKTYSGIAAAAYTPSDFLDYGTKYYWRVRAKIGTSYTDFSDVSNFTTGTPSTSIETAAAKILLRHSEGRITEITYKNGSNTQLLDTVSNTKDKTGLGRVTNEISTKLVSWTESAGSYIYTYENTTYGSKVLSIKLTTDSIIVGLQINITANKAATLETAWKPGGDIGPLNDNILYSKPSNIASKYNVIYPMTTASIYSGYSNLVAMTDERYNERFGYYVADSISTTLYEDISLGTAFAIPASASAQVKNIYFVISTKAGFYSWSNKKYIIVKSPAAGVVLKDQSTPDIKWETFGISGTLNISLSSDSGTTYPSSLAANTTDDGIQNVTLPNLSASVPLSKCIIKISGTGATGYSGVFSIVAAQSTVFTIPSDITGAPTDKISFPVIMSPAAGDTVNSIDLRLYYDKDLLTYNNYTLDPQFAALGWIDGITNNASAGYLQIGALKKATGTAVLLSDTVMNISFSIKNTARVGLTTPLQINNTYLSAGNNSAQKLKVIGEDGRITIYSRVSGNLVYIVSKKAIVGNKLVRFINVNTAGADVDTFFSNTSSTGYYDFSNKTPGNSVRLEPAGDLAYPGSITTSVDATDARMAFDGRDGGSTTLTELQKIAADINNDGIVNSIDALAILKISTGELTISSFGVKNWVFVDSTYKLTASNWASAPKNKIYFPLDSIKAKQSFWGVIRGDVDGKGYYSPTLEKTKTTDMIASANDVTYSIPSNLAALPGDTIYIPLSLKLNGKVVGAFNASISLNNDLLTYTGNYIEGNSIPDSSGWLVSAFYTKEGIMNIGATDFSGKLDPIKLDGNLALFQFVVNENAKPGAMADLPISFVSASDGVLNTLPVNAVSGKFTVTTPTSVDDNKVIYEYKLEQNYPNPFNPVTVINYSVAKDSRVNIEIYNAIGEKVITLYDGVQQAGKHNVNWNASGFASGIYFYRIKAGEFVQTRKMLLLK